MMLILQFNGNSANGISFGFLGVGSTPIILDIQMAKSF